MALGEIPFEEIVTACGVFLSNGAKQVDIFYSETDQYGRKKVIEISVTPGNQKEGTDESASVNY